MGCRILRQMQLAPHSPFLSAVFSDFSLAFAKYLEASRVDNQVGDMPLVGLPIGHFHCSDSFADKTAVRCAQRHIHQYEQRVELSLSGLQSEVENPLEHQEGADDLVSVKLAAAHDCRGDTSCSWPRHQLRR